MKASNALESMATDNYNCQKAFLELDAPRVLIKLLKVSAVLMQLMAFHNFDNSQEMSGFYFSENQECYDHKICILLQSC